jgi:hypothetical protein
MRGLKREIDWQKHDELVAQGVKSRHERARRLGLSETTLRDREKKRQPEGQSPSPQPEPLPDGWASTIQPFKDLPSHIEAAFRASIERFGVLLPVVKDQYGRVLDGHQRTRVAEALGVPYDVIVRHVASEDEALALAKTLNAERRQLTEEQRREVAFVLRQEGHSYRAIGGTLGISHVQARTDVDKAEAERGVNHLTPEQPAAEEGKHEPSGVKDLTPASVPRVIGLDRKSYPARRPRTVHPRPGETPTIRDRKGKPHMVPPEKIAHPATSIPPARIDVQDSLYFLGCNLPDEKAWELLRLIHIYVQQHLDNYRRQEVEHVQRALDRLKERFPEAVRATLET